MDRRTFIIGDVHGCALTLQHLIFKVINLKRFDRVYFLGDLIDRGPRSKEALDFIMRLQSAGFFIRSIKGNHEEMLLDSYYNNNSLQIWMENGGEETLKSFGTKEIRAIPGQYIQFLSQLPYFIELNNFILCHAGVNCQSDSPLSDKEAMLWSRDLPAIPDKIGGKKVICGHTVHSLEEITLSLGSNKIFLDGGCVFKSRAGRGNLVALETTSMKIYSAVNMDISDPDASKEFRF